MASADFSTASDILSTIAVPYHPAITLTATGHPGHPRRPPRVRPATFIAHPPRLRDGPLMDIGLRHVLLARPDRPALYAQPTTSPNSPAAPCVPRVATSPPASFPPRLTTTQLPLTCGWCHQPPQGTPTPELLAMPGAQRRGEAQSASPLATPSRSLTARQPLTMKPAWPWSSIGPTMLSLVSLNSPWSAATDGSTSTEAIEPSMWSPVDVATGA